MEPSNINTIQLRDDALKASVLFYLREGEAFKDMIIKFNGDWVTCIKWLRAREFQQYEEAQSEPQPKKVQKKEPDIMDPIHDFIPAELPKKSKAKKNTPPNSAQQENLF